MNTFLIHFAGIPFSCDILVRYILSLQLCDSLFFLSQLESLVVSLKGRNAFLTI
ncbi:hypothetical protein PAJ34TS1_09340 [Paenibacillus azoreducens]|uniref:Uncharacterized protein n=1 Tax=Paenibacillus azoreducens TaxID=116718 RepID=A0A920CU73_9BACL|nr:hypothetical protein J34TS1_47690 [Paenibacillus azoreducens]